MPASHGSRSDCTTSTCGRAFCATAVAMISVPVAFGTSTTSNPVDALNFLAQPSRSSIAWIVPPQVSRYTVLACARADLAAIPLPAAAASANAERRVSAAVGRVLFSLLIRQLPLRGSDGFG